MKFILASSSPRRQELLASIGIIPTEIINPDVDESLIKGERVRDYVNRVAVLKCQTAHTQIPDAFVLAADTVVEMNRSILLKPESSQDARQMLSHLSGRCHRVYTGVCVMTPQGKIACKIVLTRILFKRLTEDEINDYVASLEWEGKAGAYSIQGIAAKFVKNLNGSYTNVVGLPLYETDCLLKGLGFRG